MEQTLIANSAHSKKVRPHDPVYGRGEDLFNAISHIVGGGLGVVFFIILMITASYEATANKFIAAAVYSFSIITLYTMSALYHFFPQGKVKRVFRVFDHCTIFVLIAGCYTPFCLLAFWGTTTGYVMLGVEWGLAILGITFNSINMRWKAVKVLSMIAYVIMGWMIIPVIPLLLQSVTTACFVWLLVGGVAYTVGIIFFALGKNHKYMHCVWHIFVLAGSVCQFVSVMLLLLA